MKNIVTLALIVISLSFFFSCRTQQQNKLIGTWKYIPHAKPDSSMTRYFNFDNGSTLTVDDVEEGDTLQRVYSYSIEGSELNIFGDIDSLPYWAGPNEYRGKYWVDVLNKENCKIVKTEHGDGSDGNAYLRVEMVKE